MKKNNFILSIVMLTLFCGLTQAQNTYVPDDALEQALIDQGYDSGPLDDYVLTASINTVQFLYIINKGISDLTGVEDFTALKTLYCQDNNLSSLDISNNLSLKELNCSNNNLTSLEIGNNPELYILICGGNDLSSIDMTANPLLRFIDVDNNNLSSLDLSSQVQLTSLNCSNNNINTADLSDKIFLQVLNCSGNNLTTLDLSNSQFLQTADCSNNSLTSLTVDCSNLKMLLCNDNNLTSLNILKTTSNSVSINNFDCSNNLLESLNVKNINFFDFKTLGNPNLNCIEVSDVEYSTTNWTDIDPITSFSEDCLTLSVNDFSNFDVAIYPNPVNNNLKVIANSEIYTISILNTYGEKLIQTNKAEIDLSHLASGLYFVELVQGDKKIIKKIIKK